MKRAELHGTVRGSMTVAQIAEAAGISQTAACRRLRDGVSGERLFAKDLRSGSGRNYAAPTYRDAPGMGKAIEIACRLARLYADGAPPIETLQTKFGMCRATAYRWRRAWLDAGVRT